MVHAAASHDQGRWLARRLVWAGACAAGALLTLFAILAVLELRILHQHTATAQLAARALQDDTAQGSWGWLEVAAVVLATLSAGMAAFLVTDELRQRQAAARHLDGQREMAERRAAELESSHNALRAAKEAAERADRAKGRALIETVHDLRQPLLVVALASELLAQRAGKAGAQDASRAEAAIAKLDHSLLQLIQVARQSSDTATPLLRSVDLGRLLWNVCDELWPLAAAKGLQLRLVMSSAHTLTDADMLATIMRNLIGNAIKYTDRGGIVVGVRRRARGLAIQVYDSGVGIPGTKLAAVFDDFHQLAPGTSDGVGLGLSIVRRTAALLGYQVWVASTPGAGSCFTVELAAPAG